MSRRERLTAACYPESPVSVDEHVAAVMDALAQLERRAAAVPPVSGNPQIAGGR